MDLPKLKPCPFCGGKASPIARDTRSDKALVVIHCDICGSQGKAFYEKREVIVSASNNGKESELKVLAQAINAWNLRTDNTAE